MLSIVGGFDPINKRGLNIFLKRWLLYIDDVKLILNQRYRIKFSFSWIETEHLVYFFDIKYHINIQGHKNVKLKILFYSFSCQSLMMSLPAACVCVAAGDITSVNLRRANGYSFVTPVRQGFNFSLNKCNHLL